MMRYLRAVKMFTLENEMVRAEKECSMVRPWLGHYKSIQSSQSDAFLQTTIYSRWTNVTAAPLQNAWWLYHSPWQDECVTLPRLLHLIQWTKGFRYWSADSQLCRTAWCHFRSISPAITDIKGKIIVQSYPTFQMPFPYLIRDLSIISKFTQLIQIYMQAHIQICPPISPMESNHQYQRESLIWFNNDSFILCGSCGST